MHENELLAHIARRSASLAARWPGVLVGPGDDAAVLRALDRPILLTVDHLVAGRHVAPDAPADSIARKAIARTLSDIAAMAGTPLAALAAAALPTARDDADLLFDRLHHWAEHWRCPLVGGDITSTDGPLTLVITALGTPHPKRGPVLRSTAKVGDAVYVTGRLGGSLRTGRHLFADPRLDEADFLAETLGEHLHAMMDISDGLGVDGARLAHASSLRLVLEEPDLPRHDNVQDWTSAVGDGEDYELLFTASPNIAIPGQCPGGVAITRVGTATQGAGCALRVGGRLVDIASLGWEHR